MKGSKDTIEGIFTKILAWKRKVGDLDKQEKMVASKMKQSASDPIQLHNAKTLRAKLGEFTNEIGLTNNEVTFLVFTSMDMMWLSSMLINAGEFTKWFNINFAGESRDEIDFRDNKIEIWTAATTYAAAIIANYQTITGNKEIITNHMWWESLRYEKFALEMRSKFQ